MDPLGVPGRPCGAVEVATGTCEAFGHPRSIGLLRLLAEIQPWDQWMGLASGYVKIAIEAMAIL